MTISELESLYDKAQSQTRGPLARVLMQTGMGAPEAKEAMSTKSFDDFLMGLSDDVQDALIDPVPSSVEDGGDGEEVKEQEQEEELEQEAVGETTESNEEQESIEESTGGKEIDSNSEETTKSDKGMAEQPQDPESKDTDGNEG